jgi:hypothetical protein
MPPVGALNSRLLMPSGFELNKIKSAGYPRVRFDEVPGWRSLPETVGGDATPRTGRLGEDFNPAQSIGKTVGYTGRIQAGHGQGRSALERYASDLEASFSDRSSSQTFMVTSWWDTDQWIFHAKVMSFDGDDKQERDDNSLPSPWQFDFTANLRMNDGRFYWWNESGTPGDFMTWTNASSVVATNSGNAATDPIITVAGVAGGTDVHLIRDVPGGTDLDLWFRNPGAGTLIVDFSTRRAYLNNLLTDVSRSYDELASTWWDEDQLGIPPGSHTISKGPGAGTSIKVDLFSAWW